VENYAGSINLHLYPNVVRKKKYCLTEKREGKRAREQDKKRRELVKGIKRVRISRGLIRGEEGVRLKWFVEGAEKGEFTKDSDR